VPWHFGYAEELRTARAYLRTQPFFLIEGVGGVGKSAFLARLATPAAIRISAGPCWRLATLAAALDPELAPRLPPPTLRPPSRAPRPACRDTARAIADWIERTRSLVLFDDLDALAGADALLRAFLETLRAGRFVATTRRRLLPDRADVARVRLHGLDDPAAARLVREVLRAGGLKSPPAALVADIVARGKGHPLLLLASCGEHGRTRSTPRAPGGSSRSLFSRILGRLPAPSRQLLSVLAPIRTALPETAIGEIAGPTLARGIAELSARFLVERDARGRLIVPAVIAEAAAASPSPGMDEAERRALAARTGAVLSRLAADRNDAALHLEAHRHLLAGGRPAEARDLLLRAAPLLEQAGFAEAILSLARATEAALGHLDPDLRLLQAEVAIELLFFSDAERALHDVAAPELLAPRFDLARGKIAADLAQAEALFARAAEGFARAGDEARAAEALAARAHALAGLGRLGAAQEAAEAALDRASASGSPLARGAALSILSKLREEAGDFAAATRLADEAVSAFESAHRAGLAIPVLRTLADALTNLGRREEAHAAIGRGLAIAREVGSRVDEVLLLRAEASIDLFEGDGRRAMRCLDRALSLVADLGESRLSIALEMTCGEAALEAHDYARAERHFRTALAAHTAQRNALAAMAARYGLARALGDSGRNAAAEDLLSHCLRVAREQGLSIEVPDLLLARAACRARLGRFEGARADCEEAVTRLGETSPAATAFARTPLAALLWRLGEREAAARALDLVLVRDGAGAAALLAARVLQESMRGRGDGPAVDALLAAPATDRRRAIELIGMGAPPLPPSFWIVTGSGERRVDLLAALEARAATDDLDLVADGLERRVFVRERGSFFSLAKRPRLFSLLACVLRAGGRPLGPAEIAATAWGIHGYVPAALRNLVRANLHRLRSALGKTALVETVPGPACYRIARGLRFALVERGRDRSRAQLAAPARRVLEALESRGPSTARALAAVLRLPVEEVTREIERLADAGLCDVRRAGEETLYDGFSPP
jgi:tetratricopeptide (TPR) repeat protein